MMLLWLSSSAAVAQVDERMSIKGTTLYTFMHFLSPKVPYQFNNIFLTIVDIAQLYFFYFLFLFFIIFYFIFSFSFSSFQF